MIKNNRLISQVRNLTVGAVARLGFEIRRLEPEANRRIRRYLNKVAFDAIIDVGANTGQFATMLRTIGYTGRIISFEPGSQAFAALARAAAKDPQWSIHNLALGAERGNVRLNISKATDFSSIRSFKPEMAQLEPTTIIEHTETIACETLDHLLPQLNLAGSRILLKIDTQGFEDEVLRGAGLALQSIAAIQLELSAVPIYEGQVPMDEQIRRLSRLGFSMYDCWRGFAHRRSGQILEYDAIFSR